MKETENLKSFDLNRRDLKNRVKTRRDSLVKYYLKVKLRLSKSVLVG